MPSAIQETAAQIAGHLAGWTLKPTEYTHFATLGAADGAELHLSSSRVRGRLSVSGNYPRGRNGDWYGPHQDRPRITVAADRPAASIAQEIARRLLPQYLPQYQEAVARKAKTEALSARASAIAGDVAALLGVRLRDDGHGDAIKVYGERVDVTVHRYGSLKIEVRLESTDAGTATALSVLRILAGR